MSRKDTYHDTVKNTLIKEGWRITHDPWRYSYYGKLQKVLSTMCKTTTVRI